MHVTHKITSVSIFASKHRKPKRKYTIKPNKAIRRKTFALLRKMEGYCLEEIQADETMNVSKIYRLEGVLIVAQEAFLYLRMMKKLSNVRLTRFYSFLSKRQKEALISLNIKTLVDVSKISKQELAKLLRLGRGNPDPSFLVSLGFSDVWKITK